MSYLHPIAPHFMIINEKAVKIGGNIHTVTPMELTRLDSQYQIVPVERVLFGFHIPYLPSLVTSPHLAGATERERIVEILDRQMQIVANLSKWYGVAFALRYLSNPQQGEIKIQILARVLRDVGQGRRIGELLANDLVATFSSLNIPFEPILTFGELDQSLKPLLDSFALQLRQREDLIPLKISGNRAYVVYPFCRPSSTWIQTFELILRQQAPCLISIHLEPTQLYEYERQTFADIAAHAENWANYRLHSLSGPFSLPDPQARVVAQLHSDYLRRLTSPCLLAVYIASPNQMTAYAVAQALGAEITERIDIENVLYSENNLPAGFDLIAPTSQEDLNAALRHINYLDIGEWGRNIMEGRHVPSERIPMEKKRLRFLTDIRAASAAFRLPVAVRGGIPGVKTRQVMPTYDVGPRQANVVSDEIHLGVFTDRGGAVGLPIDLITKHILVAGTTGSGKTTTCFQILSQLWEKGIPFLVIEPANTIYKTLLASPFGKDVRVFTLGDESVSPFRLNPLEILPGIRVETHITALKACFEAALPTFGVLPTLIAESLHTIYADKNWNLTDRRQPDDIRLMPTLGELYFAIIRATEGRGYSEKTLQDIRAAAAGRIGSLLWGSRGRMLNTRRSFPIDELMTHPTILELEALDNDEEKALIMLFLLTMIREYCRVKRRKEPGLQHVTVIEEAHRIMRAIPHAVDREISADPRATAVDMFSASLSEVRALGEGLIIAEQIPRRLAEDALKNTNTKIVHRLPGHDDRETVGATISLSQEQNNFLTKLEPGQAAFFKEGFEHPTFITIPDYRHQHNLPIHIDEDTLKTHMVPFHNDQADVMLPFNGCRYCLHQCRYRDRVGQVVYEIEASKRFQKGVYNFEIELEKGNETAGWTEIIHICQNSLRPTGLAKDEHAMYCFFVHLWDYEFTKTMAEQFRETAKGA